MEELRRLRRSHEGSGDERRKETQSTSRLSGEDEQRTQWLPFPLHINKQYLTTAAPQAQSWSQNTCNPKQHLFKKWKFIELYHHIYWAKLCCFNINCFNMSKSNWRLNQIEHGRLAADEDEQALSNTLKLVLTHRNPDQFLLQGKLLGT